MNNISFNPPDVIKVDIPLFIRLLEYAREDAKTDMDLHNVTENAIRLSENGEVLSMKNYGEIIRPVNNLQERFRTLANIK